MEASELRERRTELGLTQAEMAAELGVSRALVSHWENKILPIRKRDRFALIGYFCERGSKTVASRRQ